MICGNCGFQNAAGDEFCGSCGQFLAWTGTPDEATQAGAGAAGAAGGMAGAAGAGGAVPPPPTGPFAPQPVVPPPGQTGPPPAMGPPPPAPPANPAIQWPAGLQRCDVCGTANELSRTFCLNCGAKLKRAGTTTSAALAVAAAQAERRRSMRMAGYAVLGTVIFVGAIAIAFVAFGGLAPVVPAATATPLSSLVAVNPSGSPVAPGSSSASSAVPTGQPSVTLPASLEPPATAVASNPIVTTPPDTAPPATPPASAPPAGGFVCSASTFSAAQAGGWKIVRAHWSRKGVADTLALEMEPSSSGSTASVDANIVAPDQVQPTYGVPGPSSGSLAIVLVFNDAVSLSGPFGSPVGYKALQEFQIYRNAGRVVVVMGVNGSGCYGLSSEAWSTGSSAAPELDVAIQH